MVNAQGAVVAKLEENISWGPSLYLKSTDNASVIINAMAGGEFYIRLISKNGKSEGGIGEYATDHRVHMWTTKDGTAAVNQVWHTP